MFKLAHVTDPHFRGWAGLGPGDLFNKRVLGLTNLVLNRRRKHRMELLEEMRVDIAARRPDHLAVTGDLSNVSLDGEWGAARRWLEGSGLPAEAVTVIPGNHDTYLPSVVAGGGFERIFAAYQRADVRAPDAPYPFARVRDGVALVAVNSCVPTSDLGAWGQIGDRQLAALEAVLGAPELRGLLRVVLLHHPPLMLKPPEHRNLRDRNALAAVLARAGAELVLHGHDHRDTTAWLEHGAGKIPVVGGGSASYAGQPGGEGRARYNVYEIERDVVTCVTYAHDRHQGGFKEAGRQRLRG